MGDEAVAATDTACSWLKLCYRMKQEHRAAITRKPQVKQDLFFFFLKSGENLLGPQLPGPSTMLGEGTGTPLQYSCLENPMDGGAW